MGYTSFGYTLACHALARECGLDSMLKNSFGESMAKRFSPLLLSLLRGLLVAYQILTTLLVRRFKSFEPP